MNSIKMIFSLCIVLGMFYGIYKIIGKIAYDSINFVNHVVGTTDKVVIVALISGVISIIGIVITSIIGKKLEYKLNINKYLFEKREKSYQEFIELVYDIQILTKNGNEMQPKEMVDRISKFSKQLTLWGSSKVIKKWLQFRRCSVEEQKNTTEALFVMENIIFEIRKDMGQKGKLDKGDLLSFFVNDIDKYLPIKGKNTKK